MNEFKYRPTSDLFDEHFLSEILRAWPHPTRYVVLVSGGMDSMVLLEAMARIRSDLPAPVVGLNFDHGIDPNSMVWTELVVAAAARLGVPCRVECLRLGPEAGETRARSMRYEKLGRVMAPGDCCLSAHHADDQGETFLLHALRGAGLDGLSAMPMLKVFGSGWLGRPLMGWSRRQLTRWALGIGLEWIEDPGNRNLRVPRNRLRQRLWPVLETLWPDPGRRLAATVGRLAEARSLLEEMAAEDLDRLSNGADCERLPVDALLKFSIPRRHNLLRYWLRAQTLPVPSARKLDELEARFILRDPGPRAVILWPGCELHRYRGSVYAFVPYPELPSRPRPLSLGSSVDLGRLGRVGLVSDSAGKLDVALLERPLNLRFRCGGERIYPQGSRHHRPVKKLMQEARVLPWMRNRLPLIYAGEDLIAVAGLAVAECAVGHGLQLEWKSAPRWR